MLAIIRDRIFVFQFAIEKLYRNYFACCLNGCETWSLNFSEVSRLKFFENRVLRRVLGTKRTEEKGERRKLHNEELNDLFCSVMVCG